MATCSEPDCERTLGKGSGRGLCRNHYAYHRRHDTLPPLAAPWTGCEVDGCDREHEARHLCAMHYQRLTKSEYGLEQPVSTAPDDVRFWAKVDRSGGPAACWLWLAGLNIHGYGNIWWNGSTEAAHRIAYQLTKGEIPAGLHLDHLCMTRSCVNPAHLEPVTAEVNNQRIPMTPQRREKLVAAGRKGGAAKRENYAAARRAAQEAASPPL